MIARLRRKRRTPGHIGCRPTPTASTRLLRSRGHGNRKYDLKYEVEGGEEATQQFRLVNEWLDWDKRLEYKTTTFNPRPIGHPDAAKDDELNLWFELP